jgi:outer membrane protein OmpA-like peptidoglycan-associated protein
VFGVLVRRRSQKVEGESPFWISFSDLMSALMVLFMVVMAVTLISVTKDVSTVEQRRIQRESDITQLMSTIKQNSKQFPQINVYESTYRIDLGEVVHFDSGTFDIGADPGKFLRTYVPVLLNAQASQLGQMWIRRIVVEGFTDQDGTYLRNLSLSLQRSKQVVCTLFAIPSPGETPLSDAQKRQIESLFLVGGYSFNSMKASKEESRRVELKIDFWALDEQKDSSPSLDDKDIGQCSVN